MDGWLSVAEAALQLGVSRSAVNYAIQGGRLRAERVGRNYAIRVEDVKAYSVASTPAERAKRPRPRRQGIEPVWASEALRRKRQTAKQ